MLVSRSFLIIVALATLAGALASPSPLLVAGAGTSLAVGTMLLWNAKEPPILMLPFGMQWLSVAVKPIETALSGKPLDELADFGEPLQTAAVFAMLGVTAFALGMRLASRSRLNWNAGLMSDAARWKHSDVIFISAFLIVFGHVLEFASNYAGGARQILLAFAGIKNAGLFILCISAFATGRGLAPLVIIAGLEIVFGLTGFFAGFREAVLVLCFAAATGRPRMNFGAILVGAVAFATLMSVAIFWSAVKKDYRDFLNGGSGQQIVVQPLDKRLEYISDAAARYDREEFDYGFQKLTSRVSYIDFLAKTLQNVPANVPHQNGRQSLQTLVHIVTPRILFPNKPPTPDDTSVTVHFTGMNLREYAGASISIGYLGELYIDFGYVGGLLGSLALGAFAGWAYSRLRAFDGIPLLMTYGVTVMAMMPFAIFESALIKLVGSCVTIVIAAFVVQRVIAPAVLPRVLQEART